MEQTPRANRIHIGIYGRCNSGKSSLINAITGQQTAVVSEVAGTTTDTVNKSMELPGVQSKLKRRMCMMHIRLFSCVHTSSPVLQAKRQHLMLAL